MSNTAEDLLRRIGAAIREHKDPQAQARAVAALLRWESIEGFDLADLLERLGGGA